MINAFELFGIEYERNDAPIGVSALIVTSPDYFGNVADVAGLREKNPDALLIVDEAHGAHFAYSKLLPDSAVKYADFIAQSMHKTMPVYTGGALLLMNAEENYLAARETRAKLHTTSPSYLVMASMDLARFYFEKNGEEYYREIKKAIDALELPSGFERVKNDDFSRLVVRVPQSTTGYAVAKAAEKNGIYFELATSDKVVAIITPYNYRKLALLKDLSVEKVIKEDYSYLLGLEAENDIILYPPGIVIVKKGDKIGEREITIINEERERILGL